MNLDRPSIERWIEALRREPGASVIVPAETGPLSQFTEDAEWQLGFYMTAFFYVVEDAMQEKLVTGVPRLFERFDAATSGALTHEQHPDSGKVFARGARNLTGIADRFESGRGDVVSINSFNKSTKESSPRFSLETICEFDAECRPGSRGAMFSYFGVRVPLQFWRTHRAALEVWWQDAIALLEPEQAYAGIALNNPPILERYPFVEPAEFALCQAFYGLDVDKPFFMRGSGYCEHQMHLELGTRTPTFGTLLRGKYLEQLGGESAVRQALADDERFRLRPCAGGLWIEAGDEPALYPVDEGIPEHYAKLAKLMKPTRLESLWLISYLPPLPREDCFNAISAARWLKRFDDDGDWPSPQARSAAPRPAGAAGALPAQASQDGRAMPGEAVPRAGVWWTPAIAGEAGRLRLRAGDRLPETASTDYGAVTWYWRAADQG